MLSFGAMLAVYADSATADPIETLAKGVLLRWGVPTGVILLVLLVLQHLGVLHKIVVGFWTVLSKVSRYAARRATQNTVADRLNKYLGQVVFPRLADTRRPDLAIEFVETADEVRQHADGRVIVRMRQDRDPELNLLLALSTAVSQVFFPNVRPWLTKRARVAIDLQIISDLATTMTDRAWVLFNTHILQPRLTEDLTLEELFLRIQKIAEAGLFEPVLLQELIQLSDRLVRKNPSGVGIEIEEFVNWLYSLAIKPRGEDMDDLSFQRSHVKSSVLLAARRETAMHGTEPYRKRARRNFFSGDRQLYLLGMTGEHKAFVDEIATAILGDKLSTLVKTTEVKRKRDGETSLLHLVMFRRDELRFSGKTYADFARDEGIEVGKQVEGAVREISDEGVVVQLGEVEGKLSRNELGWGFFGKPQWLIAQAAPITVLVTEVIADQCVTRVSVKRLRPSPWVAGWAPKRDDRCKGEVIGLGDRGQVIVRVRPPKGVEGEMFGTIPISDWSWYADGDPHYVAPKRGLVQDFRVTESSAVGEHLRLSRATLEARDWATVDARYPKAKLCRGKVIQVDYDGVRCELEEGVFGRIDRPQLVKAGFEYADFTNTVVPGQAIDVRVIGRRQKRQFLKLDLQRNT